MAKKQINKIEWCAFALFLILICAALILPMALLILILYPEMGNFEPIFLTFILSITIVYLSTKIYRGTKEKYVFWVVYVMITLVLLAISYYIAYLFTKGGL